MSQAVFPTFAGLNFPTSRAAMFKTVVKEAVSLKEQRGSFSAYPKYKISLGFDYLSLADMQTMAGFFRARRGKWDSFLFDDASDNSTTAQGIGTGNGSLKAFQLTRSVGGFSEPVENPKAGAQIFVNGSLKTITTDYTIGSTGIVTFVVAPASGAAITWTGGYYYRCRFDADEMELAEFMRNFYELKKLVLIGATGNKV